MGPDWQQVTDITNTAAAVAQAAAAWRPSEGKGSEPPAAEEPAVPGSSLAVPAEGGPVTVRGRDRLADQLISQLDAGTGDLCVLASTGGMGKTTLARLVAKRARGAGSERGVWWICAANEERLSGGLVSLARQIGASVADQERIRSHTAPELGDVADRLWDLLEHRRPGWLLVFDGADDPALLGPMDGTGWIRVPRRGTVLVTTRVCDEMRWPNQARLHRIEPLPVKHAVAVLTDLAPHAGDELAAERLAKRLGCLPLALTIAGLYLRREFSAWSTFDEYRSALDVEGAARVIDMSAPGDRQALVTRTWDLSLDALVEHGLRQTRPLMWLLSCFAPDNAVPEALIRPTWRLSPKSGSSGHARHPVAKLLDPDHVSSPDDVVRMYADGMQGLASVGLIEGVDDDGQRWIRLHPLIGEITQATMDAADGAVAVGSDPMWARESAVRVMSATIGAMDAGRADQWPSFHRAAPHVTHLLRNTAPRLDPRWREELLDCAVACATSSMWSRAEQRAEQFALEAMTLGRALGCGESPSYLRLRHVYGWSLREQFRYGEAESELSGVLKEQSASPGGAERDDALRTRHDLAWTLGRLGRWQQAERELRQVLQLRRERLQKTGTTNDDADVLHTRCMICWCVGKQGGWEQAERGYRSVAADRSALLGADHPDTLDTGESLGKTFAWQGKWAQAQAEFDRVAAGRAETLGDDHPDTLLARQLAAYASGQRALLERDRKRRRAAINTLQQILRKQRSIRGDDHPHTRDTQAFLAVLNGRPTPEEHWTEDLPMPPT